MTEADRVVAFVSSLTHTGDYAGEPFRLRPWQEVILRRIFGPRREDGTRQVRKAFLALPRKQGKTELWAALGLYLMAAGTGKVGQHVYTASGDHKQAALIFRAAASMVRNNPTLDRLCTVYDGYKRIEFHKSESFLEALSSESSTKHGLGPSAVLFDEVHVLPNRELHDILTTGFGARREPFTGYITTAGWDRHSLCWEVWDYARKVRDEAIVDPTFCPILYETPVDADWTDEAVWRAVMPALGDFCQLDFIREECKRAQAIPAYENTFRQLYLNQWTQQATRWIALDRWRACSGEVDRAALALAECYGGLDLSQTRDLTAWVLVFPGEPLRVLCRFWAPAEGIWRDDATTRELYVTWHRQGYLTLTPGEVIDYEFVEEQIVADAETFDLRGLFADRAMALHLCLRLRDSHGIPVEFLPQTPMALNGPARELERLLLCGGIAHGGNPVLDWNAANVAIRTNATGLIQPDKAQSSGRIDGIAALLNALACLGSDGSGGPSIYETEGAMLL